MRVRQFRILRIFARASVAVLFSLSCAIAKNPSNIENLAEFHDFASRRGEIPSCHNQGRNSIIFPGMGGDTVSVGSGKPAYVIDEGDSLQGATLENHDRLVILNARPEQFRIARKGSSLLLCSKERDIAIVIVRQYCAGEDADGLWNNAIEEITFSSGETWLRDDLYSAGPDAAPYLTRELLERYRLSGVSDKEMSNWKYARMSEKLPPLGFANRYCESERKRFRKATGD